MVTISKRVDQMMGMPFGKWPLAAFDYCKELSRRYGYCGEVAVTALYHYLQYAEGMKCDDDLYTITTDGESFFRNYGISQVTQ